MTARPRCPTCNQPLPGDPELCTCGHPVTSHELNTAGKRTWCAHGTQAGPCGCRRFELAEPAGYATPVRFSYTREAGVPATDDEEA